MKKHQTLTVRTLRRLHGGTMHLTLCPQPGEELAEMQPGQFVEVKIGQAHVLLNRPFSIFNADSESLELLVKPLGRATSVLAQYSPGDTLDVISPLGRGFDMPDTGSRVLLVGGGVGVAPFYYHARRLTQLGIRPTLIFGERTAPDPWLTAALSEVADLLICTDDGSEGFHGLVTAHPAFAAEYDLIQVCGPMPMMKAVHAQAKARGIAAQFSLENKMACGLGACLCCVEKTTTGNRCTCTDGPVFNLDELPW